MKSVRVVPIVVGALGATSLSLQKHLEILPVNYKEGQLVKQALLGTAYILQDRRNRITNNNNTHQTLQL
jgi:hypothetical protein